VKVESHARARASALAAEIGPPVVMFVLFLTLWKAATLLLDIQPYIIPPPERVLQSFQEDGLYLLKQLEHTVRMAVLGFGLAAAIGIGTGVLFSQSRVLEKSLFPYAILLQTTPIVAVAPLIVLWAGIGDNSIVIIAFIIALFPIIANTTLGLTSVDRNLINLFEMGNASRWQKLLWLQLPYAMPNVFTGLRISSGLAVIGAIIGEFLVGTGGYGGGMGYTLILDSGQLRTARMFAAIGLTALLGLSVFALVGLVGNLLLKNWHESAVTHEN
jgi:NitT/TauT family transport system permease protein